MRRSRAGTGQEVCYRKGNHSGEESRNGLAGSGCRLDAIPGFCTLLTATDRRKR